MDKKQENNRNGLTRKPSIKKKPPEVKQTLTSKYRLLKANPLLMNELEKVVVNSGVERETLLLNKPLKTLANVLGNSYEVTNSKSYLQTPAISKNNPNPKVDILSKPKSNFNSSNTSKIDFRSGNFLSSTVIESKQESVKNDSRCLYVNKPSTSRLDTSFTQKAANYETSQSSVNNKPQQKGQINKKPEVMRRKSLSAQHFDNSKRNLIEKLRNSNAQPKERRSTILVQNKKNPVNRLRKSLSAEELFDKSAKKSLPKRSQSFENNHIDTNKVEHNISTITEENSSFNTAPSTPFKTPNVQSRKSLKTPNTTNNRRSLFLPSTPRIEELSERLNGWLQRRGKSIGDFHHLKCFGLKTIIKETERETENKENSDVSNTNIVENTVNEKVNVEAVAKEALQDLNKLILEGYCSEQCENWLKLIKKKYNKLEEDPQYWECRAALEESKGDINLAVECYKTAIIQGAEVQAVDKSLDLLLQKFSLLNINMSEETNTKETKERARIVQDARNIFKSSIIRFAVQERTLKKKTKEGVIIEKQMVATPVRRSTRSSRNKYTSTPGVKIYSSLEEIDSETRSTIHFHTNKAL